MAYCSNDNNNNNNSKKKKIFFDSIAYGEKKGTSVSEFVCSNIYLINADYFCFVIRITQKSEEPEQKLKRTRNL